MKKPKPLYTINGYAFFTTCIIDISKQDYKSTFQEFKYVLNPINEVLLNYFIFNTKDFSLKNIANVDDDFTRVFRELVTNQKSNMEIQKNNNGIKIINKVNQKVILESINGQIIYFDTNKQIIKDSFLSYSNNKGKIINQVLNEKNM